MNIQTYGLIALAGIGLWYFGINPESRKFDLLGMLNLPTLGSSAQAPAEVPTSIQEMIAQEPYANLDPIEVTDALYPPNVPPPVSQPPTPSDLKVDTIAAAYNTMRTVEDTTVLPRKVSGLM